MLHTHGRQKLQPEREAELALVYPVDEHLHVNNRALGFQPTSQVLVGELPRFPQFFDDGLGAQVVKGPRTRGWSYIFFHLRASYGQCFCVASNKSISIYV